MMDGLLFVDKPSGPTSYDLIRWIKRTVKNVKIGHTGTLDPLASGLMIILFGRSTKKQSALMGQDKVYSGRLRLGVKTDSGDITGQVTQQAPIPPVTTDLLTNVAHQMTGAQMQIPPMYSAIKKDGQPLYKLARRGVEVERAPRPVHIHKLSLALADGPDIDFQVHCSSGTYVRVLVEDIGQKLGTVATMTELRRDKIGQFSVDQAVLGETLKALTSEQLQQKLVTAA